MSEIGTIEFVFLLILLFVIAFGLLSRKIGTPYPIVMVIGGLLLGFIPAIPDVALNPDLVFLIILPPLLYASAWTTSWRDFRYNLLSIILLAFGLVGFTVVGVALIAPRVFAGFDWRLGLVLGAVVAPTDAIAATSIAKRIGLPARIVDILEGESLLNDATGLLALQFATAIVVSRRVPTVTSGILTFVWLVVGGVGLGLLVGLAVDFVERKFDDGPLEIALSILVPYAVYLAADNLHASGVLAVVACGLLLSRRSRYLFSPSVRIQIWSFWQSFSFVLNGLVFVLIGLQLSSISGALGEHNGSAEYSLRTVILDGAVFSGLLILLRLVWIFPSSSVAFFLRRTISHQHVKALSFRETFVIGWTGMRGVVSLAAALALPAVLDNGKPFPHRNLIVFLTFCVIFVTLVMQGITLPPLIRLLGLAGETGPNCEEQEARQMVIEAALRHLEDAKQRDDEQASEIYDDLAGHYRQRLATLKPEEENEHEVARHGRFLELSLEALRVERETLGRLNSEGRINDTATRRIERELDLMESRFELANE